MAPGHRRGCTSNDAGRVKLLALFGSGVPEEGSASSGQVRDGLEEADPHDEGDSHDGAGDVPGRAGHARTVAAERGRSPHGGFQAGGQAKDIIGVEKILQITD